MKVISLIILCVVLLPNLNCGNGGDNGSNSGKVQAEDTSPNCPTTHPTNGASICYKYSDSVNGVFCTTKAQEFSSSSEYCAGLINEALNNNCATQKRNEDYNKYCKGA